MTVPETAATPASGAGLGIAFQPIAQIAGGRIHAYEAMVLRDNQPAAHEFDQLSAEQRCDVDRRCAVAAIRWAATAGFANSGGRLAIPLSAPAIGDPAEHIAPALLTARQYGIVAERLVFTLHHYQAITNSQLADIMHVFGKLGPVVAFHGIGPNESGLAACGKFAPHAVTIEPELVTSIASSWSRRIAIEDLVRRMQALGLRIVAAGVDNEPVYERIRAFGVPLVQGSYVGVPATGVLPQAAMRNAA
ncbi:EAL domain-containing protein [Sphingomonas sp. KR3-1]|uniref:EAL domain-containing protein n=1 Tax=Sphingomonas sp. KR3-1 TaxID=3156611 RepID=UPI0032B62788